MLDALSDKGKSFFFGEKMQAGLQERIKSAVPSTADVPSDIPHLSPKSILHDDYDFLRAAAMRVLCRDLSKAPWLANEFRKHVKDQVDPFFTAVMSSNPPDQRIQHQCFDALDRCYYIAYVALRPALKTYVRDPVNWFKKFADYIISNEHLDRWVPTLREIPDGQPSMITQLQMKRHKLALLKSVAGDNGGGLDVDKAINALMQALKERGVLKPGDLLLKDKHVSASSIGRVSGENRTHFQHHI